MIAAAVLAFAFLHESGEASRDYSLFSTTFTVDGDKVHMVSERHGRAADYPGIKDDKAKDFTLKSPEELTKLLDALDKVAVPKKEPRIQETQYERMCVERNKKKRCGVLISGAKEDENMKALRRIYDILLQSTF